MFVTKLLGEILKGSNKENVIVRLSELTKYCENKKRSI